VPAHATTASYRRPPPFIANEGRNRWHWRFDTTEKYQIMMKNYYRFATEGDATSQSVLDELERQGVLDNTLVIFTTDNGDYHAEHGLADKWYPHQEIIRVPLIAVDPRMDSSHRNQLNHDLTLNVDIAPTLLEAAGIPAPSTMPGRDLSPLYLAKTPADWRTGFF
jgi:arylsulfatase